MDDLNKKNTFDSLNSNLIFLIKNKENLMFIVNPEDLSIRAQKTINHEIINMNFDF